MQDVKEKVKVVDIVDVPEEEISKLDNIRIIIKGILKEFYKGKFSNFLLSSGFLYMVYAGIVEEFYLVSLIYGVAFLRFTDFKKAYGYAKDLINEYKMKKEGNLEENLVEGEKIYNELLNDNEQKLSKSN